jgi:hypothetical protein
MSSTFPSCVGHLHNGTSSRICPCVCRKTRPVPLMIGAEGCQVATTLQPVPRQNCNRVQNGEFTFAVSSGDVPLRAATSASVFPVYRLSESVLAVQKSVTRLGDMFFLHGPIHPSCRSKRL